MKRFLIILIMCFFVPYITSCVNTGGVTSQNSSSDLSGNTLITPANNATIIYFSCTQKTQVIAQKISDITGASLQRILPLVPYTEEDLAYYTDCRADREQRDDSARPEIQNELNVDYDIIFLGYPIWHGLAPKIMYTFMESYDLKDKTIIPFCTSGSSGVGSSASQLAALSPDADFVDGKRFAQNASNEEIAAWIDSLNLTFYNVSNFDLSKGVNGKAPTVRLNSGYDMPVLGLGTYSLHGDVCKNSVRAALESGVRLIDTAYIYGNEQEIGEAIRQAVADGICKREDIFVITKLYPGNQFANPEQAIQDSLDKLNIGYIDMMLLHHPGTNDVKAYKAMEAAKAQGKIRSLGLSNWYIEEIDDFISQISVMPSLIQNEIHIYYQEKEVVPYMHNLGIVMQAWYPLGGRGHTSEILNDPVICDIAAEHNVSSAQVILRWHLQRGVVAIPGSSNPDHIKENISVFEFSLTSEQMQAIASLDRNEKHDWY